ncbi:hypothetical protein [Streptomyces sp. NBC_01304]|uniref:hypothetical protein n=1 Tax=Streptomyces sp. NBC_01304 TaxID=2903818 RepID=UPI002E0D141F|nr:hypothetical protein OG430_23185 [Streptomyces sp. NBC_01304]
MARIRTIKPEAFASESLAAVSVHAERTFFGLLTQADDHGRFRDQPAVIAGVLWSLRPEHSPLDVEDDLNQLDTAELICRYEGEDGKRYLHVVGWSRHQKINRPSGSRCPACPRHDGSRPAAAAAGSQVALSETAVSLHDGFSEGSDHPRIRLRIREAAGQDGFSEPSVHTPVPDLGSRTMDLGKGSLGGASAPAPSPASAAVSVSAKELLAEYVAACAHQPPEKLLRHLGREINQLLGERIDAAHIRRGLERLRAKGLSPSVLPSAVNEAMNAGQSISPAHGRTWASSAEIAAAYGSGL